MPFFMALQLTLAPSHHNFHWPVCIWQFYCSSMKKAFVVKPLEGLVGQGQRRNFPCPPPLSGPFSLTREFKHHVHGKRKSQIHVENFSK